MATSTLTENRLEGKVAIITGGASGIGEATARLFAEHGALVVIADVQDELGHKLTTSIGLNHATYMHCDVTDEEQVKATVDHTLATYGRLDIMFSNAGIGGSRDCRSILDMNMPYFDKIYAVNVRGMAAAIKHAARVMVDQNTGGSIICTASVTSILGGVAVHDYTISKHAVVGLVRSTAAELGKYGIRVNCISPFGVATPMLCSAFSKLVAEGSGCITTDVERICDSVSNLHGVTLKARDIADAALFLGSDASAFISGHNLVIDGGFTVVNHALRIYK
ncbi:short-chain dehydrogenase reductase 3b-like [Magnolia sinica]|uniref:short-chain dehydrogenase reductase 3b-like n=1 Tax=Magnolia sinica TaxID=86752 RepID=UPI002657D7F4|nr:short-chain dehydrogenase reductase 3b-like [Magnolia sinica]